MIQIKQIPGVTFAAVALRGGLLVFTRCFRLHQARTHLQCASACPLVTLVTPVTLVTLGGWQDVTEYPITN